MLLLVLAFLIAGRTIFAKRCGPGFGGCYGAGPDGFFYRCCSQYGFCGPKNLEDQHDYCHIGCQPEFGECGRRPDPGHSPFVPAPAQDNGGRCGALFNARCPEGYCCSGSNYCGVGPEYCSPSNFCQIGYGQCDDDYVNGGYGYQLYGGGGPQPYRFYGR